MYVFSSFVRIWRIARQKLGAGGFPVPILEQSSQRIPQPAVSVLRCYSSATKELSSVCLYCDEHRMIWSKPYKKCIARSMQPIKATAMPPIVVFQPTSRTILCFSFLLTMYVINFPSIKI
ncbi:uncharacterized protein LOC114295064 isoform X1 [Camellia sinensis]|uniref:uncharacterized protein LOC114295064 isoform X1 n=1 Tax=Camellia sinensis TaxID=4442 RepID=UPI0010361CE6|nr:uncharacterized protein LOC114295064 isoform X1 [Camellia sinensis]